MHRIKLCRLLPLAIVFCLALSTAVWASGYAVRPGSSGNELVLLVQVDDLDIPVDIFAEMIEGPDWVESATIAIEAGTIPKVVLRFDVAASAPLGGQGLLVVELQAYSPDGFDFPAMTRRVPLYVASEAPEEQYSYRVEECCLLITGLPQDESGNPLDHVMLGNSPNPLRGLTSIRFGLPQGDASAVTLRIIDVTGRRVATLQTPPLSAGYHQIIWEGRNDAGKQVASGIYFYELSTPEWRASGKMTVLR